MGNFKLEDFEETFQRRRLKFIKRERTTWLTDRYAFIERCSETVIRIRKSLSPFETRITFDDDNVLKDVKSQITRLLVDWFNLQKLQVFIDKRSNLLNRWNDHKMTTDYWEALNFLWLNDE